MTDTIGYHNAKRIKTADEVSFHPETKYRSPVYRRIATSVTTSRAEDTAMAIKIDFLPIGKVADLPLPCP